MHDFWNFLAYFGHVFACSCWETPPLLTWFSSFLVRSSANFAKKIQELAEDKAENPRTCRGQRRELNPYERQPENSNLKALFSQSPSLTATLQTENAGRRYSPLGGFNPPPNLGRRVRSESPGLLVLPSPSPWTKFLTQRFWELDSRLPPPKSSPSSLGLTPYAAAICGAGASWRLLGRKNRVPRGLQKLIKL